MYERIQTRLNILEEQLNDLELLLAEEERARPLVRHIQSLRAQRDTLQRLCSKMKTPESWAGFEHGFEQAVDRLETASRRLEAALGPQRVL